MKTIKKSIIFENLLLVTLFLFPHAIDCFIKFDNGGNTPLIEFYTLFIIILFLALVGHTIFGFIKKRGIAPLAFRIIELVVAAVSICFARIQIVFDLQLGEKITKVYLPLFIDEMYIVVFLVLNFIFIPNQIKDVDMVNKYKFYRLFSTISLLLIGISICDIFIKEELKLGSDPLPDTYISICFFERIFLTIVFSLTLLYFIYKINKESPKKYLKFKITDIALYSLYFALFIVFTFTDLIMEVFPTSVKIGKDFLDYEGFREALLIFITLIIIISWQIISSKSLNLVIEKETLLKRIQELEEVKTEDI